MPELRPPLTPADCDLRDFPFMPFEVRRLLTSETWMMGSGDVRAASVALWLESWHQVPAGSLPNKAPMLAHLSQMAAAWERIKDDVLAGWVACDDGRLYHPVVCEKALEAWLEKLSYRMSSGKGNAIKYKGYFDPIPLAQKINSVNEYLLQVNPHSKKVMRLNADKLVVVNPQLAGCEFGGKAPKTPDPTPDPAAKGSGTDRKGEGEREGQGLVGGEPPTTPSAEAPGVAGSSQPTGFAGDDNSADAATEGADGPTGGDSGEVEAPGAKTAKKAPMDGVVVPDWVPVDKWADFVAMRKKMGKSVPFTPAAATGILKKLADFRDRGHEPGDILQASIESGYRSVFEPKTGGRPGGYGGGSVRHAGAAQSIYGAGGVDGGVIDV